jgi:hypothetical protein
MTPKVSIFAKVMFAMLTVLLGPAASRASVTYTVTIDGTGIGSATQFSFTEPTIATAGDTTSITQISGTAVTEFSWNSNGNCNLGGFIGDANACISYTTDLFESFTAGSFLVAGTYTSIAGDVTVNISGVPAVPEPSSMILFGSGVLALLRARRKLLG